MLMNNLKPGSYTVDITSIILHKKIKDVIVKTEKVNS